MSLQQTATLDDYYAFVSRPENADRLFELIDGEIVEVSPSFLPSAIGIQIAYYIKVWLHAQNPKSGYITGADGGYMMPDGGKYNPDVGYIRKSRLTEIPAREVPMMMDFAVEVLSPSDADHRRRVTQKVDGYKSAKVPLLWVVEPKDKTVQVYAYGEDKGIYKRGDTLDGGDVLPGFSLPVRDVFDIE